MKLFNIRIEKPYDVLNREMLVISLFGKVRKVIVLKKRRYITYE